MLRGTHQKKPVVPASGSTRNTSEESMSRRRRSQRSKKVGLPPGALILLGDVKMSQASIALFDYDASGLAEHRFASIAESQAYHPQHRTSWLNVHGLQNGEVMSEIGRRFNLHPLVLEDILNTDQRPKVDDYGDYLYIVARFFEYDAAALSVSSEQVSIVLGRDFVLTFQERPTGWFDPIRERLRHDKGQIRTRAADYLAYSLLDAVVDRYFHVLEQIAERSEQLEDELLERPQHATLSVIHRLKRETLEMRRSVWPLREMLATLHRNDSRFFSPDTQLYLRDVYDHTVHVIESLEGIRDLIGGLLDVYLSSMSNRVNVEVRVLTVITTVFMPASLIAGIFGMNFRDMPLLDSPGGFALALSLMAAIATTMGIFFWRRRLFS